MMAAHTQPVKAVGNVSFFLTDSTGTRDNNNHAENPTATHTQPVKAVGDVSEPTTTTTTKVR
jgi:hypothetical protein